MKLRTLASVAGLALALGAGPALAWDLHDTLYPSSPDPAASQGVPNSTVGSYADGADLRLPSGTTAGIHESDCLDARATSMPGSFDIATYCGPGAR